MLEFSNLDWPEAPFGADQRPFGKPSAMAAGFAVDRIEGGPSYLSAAAAVYLRVSRVAGAPVPADQLRFGFHCLTSPDLGDDAAMITVFDRALLRARRHAVVVAATAFEPDLEALAGSAGPSARGVTGMLNSWRDREIKARGTATMFDAAFDHVPAGLTLPSCTERHAPGQRAIERALSSAIVGACSLRMLTLTGTADIHKLVGDAAWDQLPAGLEESR